MSSTQLPTQKHSQINVGAQDVEEGVSHYLVLTGYVIILNVERRKSQCCWLGGATADSGTAEGEAAAAAAAVPLCWGQ